MSKLLCKKPKWFKLSNYPSHIGELNLYDWAKNIHDRYKIYEYIENSKGSKDEIERLIYESRNEGFFTLYFRIPDDSVKPVTGNEVLKLTKQICKQIPDALHVYDEMQNDIIFKDRALGILKVDHELRKPWGMSGDDLYLSINLNTPQNTLLEQFTKLIKAKQLEKITKSGITQEQIKKWIKYQVLAYIDLSLFALEKGQKLPNSVAGKWLFPNDRHRVVDDIIKRHTKPLSVKLMEKRFIKSLINQTGSADTL